MKKILAIALVAVFVLGMAVSAFAEGSDMKASGSYRLRAISTNNTNDLDDDTGDHDGWYNQRLRLGLDFVVGEDVTVSTRGDIAEGNWDGKSETQSKDFDVDHAFVVIKKFDMTFTLGLQEASWGNKFWSYGNQAERVKVAKKFGDIMVGAFTQKDDDDHIDMSSDGAGDQDSNAVFVVAPFGDQKVSVIYVQTIKGEGDVDGTTMDVAYTGKVGPANLAAEYVQKSGDLFETIGYATGDGENPMGFFVHADMDVTDSINVGLAYATAANGFVADDDFSPTLLFGQSGRATAIMQFGSTTSTADIDTTGATQAGQAAYNTTFVSSGGSATAAKAAQKAAYDLFIATEKLGAVGDDKTSAIVVAAKMKLSDDMNAGANFATGSLSDENEVDVQEIDLWMDYKLATNTTFWVGVAQATLDIPGVDADPITSAAFQIETKF